MKSQLGQHEAASKTENCSINALLSVPTINLPKKGLPQYFDVQDADAFLLSSAEDLVQQLVQNAQGKWEHENLPKRVVNGVTYLSSSLPILKEDAPWPEPPDASAPNGSNSWLFEVVFDYDKHDANIPMPNEAESWPERIDPFSPCRAGLEVRTYRACQRVLMFRHFLCELGVEHKCPLRFTDFRYSDEVEPTDVRNPVYTFLKSGIQTSYQRNNGGHDRCNLQPVEFEYTKPIVQDRVEELYPQCLKNPPIGLDDGLYGSIDLCGWVIETRNYFEGLRKVGVLNHPDR